MNSVDPESLGYHATGLPKSLDALVLCAVAEGELGTLVPGLLQDARLYTALQRVDVILTAPGVDHAWSLCWLDLTVTISGGY